MNRIFQALVIVQFVLIGFLFFKIYNSPGGISEESKSGTGSDSLAKKVAVSDEQASAPVVYVNIDTLLEKYEYYQKVSKEVEKAMQGIENSFKSKVIRYQKDFNEYIEKAGAGLIPKEQAMAKEEELMRRKQAIEQEEQSIPALQMREEKKLEEVQIKLYNFFKSFTKANNYSCVLTYNVKGAGALGVRDELDVTSQVVKVLNDQYREEQKSKK
jgi:outer membrane protein